ncbi:MAG: tetratricopeptide repeat protein [Candidatus Eiseniibacteriota bacterium]
MRSSVSSLRRLASGVLGGAVCFAASTFVLAAEPTAVASVVSHAADRVASTTMPPPGFGEHPPTDPADLQGWLDYKAVHDLPSLPHAALLLFRLGKEAQQRGDHETAVRLWRGAEELDPSLLAPRFALARHFLGRDPSQGLIEIARIVGMARSSFRMQHFMVSYALFYGLSALYLATLGVALLVCWRHRNRIRHVLQELMLRFLPENRAQIWSWVLILLPFALGLGIAIPAVFLLAVMWHYLRKSERVAFGLLVGLLCASPFVMRVFDDLSRAARVEQAPFYSTIDLDHEAYSPERMDELTRLAAEHPENAFLAFAEGWMAQRGQRYDEAVAAYQRAQAAWPREARIPNNLGNIEFLRGNVTAAEASYKRAIELAPRWAAPHYNLGQLHTARFRYAEASEEIAQATALDFDLVRNLQARSALRSTAALAEEWLEPPGQWQALFAAAPLSSGRGAAPPLWRPWFESRGVPVAVWAGLFTVLGLAIGFMLHHQLPARVCGNCGAAVCRRCATRRRDQVLCVECATLVANATTPEFGRLLLFKRRRETRRAQGRIRSLIAAVVPGYGAVAYEKVLTGWILGVFASLCLLLLVAGSAPFPYDPRLPLGSPRPLGGFALFGFLVVYAISVLHYLSVHGRANEEEAGLEATGTRKGPRLQQAA